MTTSFYGIRHHGPGSARALREALVATQPDKILIELPADAQKLVDLTNPAVFTPPVAMLCYESSNPARASFLPFAAFSPEWIALQYAAEHKVPVVAMDLPLGVQWAMSADEKNVIFDYSDPESRLMTLDPLGYLSKMSGYDDTEQWWELFVEQQQSGPEVFEALIELMTELRQQIARIESQETLLREAHMRKCIREAAKSGANQIAVICGAWHVPAIVDALKEKPAADTAALKGLPKIKTDYTWTIWSHQRLSFESGYGAGIESPVWNLLLYENSSRATVEMLSRAARLLREKRHITATADVIEACRLAEVLAQLRGRAVPGLGELNESVASVLCQGDALRLQMINSDWLVGHAMGILPDNLPVPPIQKDLEKNVSSARLSKYYKTTETGQIELDLRKASQRFASRLLHRTVLLELPWARWQSFIKSKRLSSKETWELKWQPDFVPLLIRAAHWGSTVVEAAQHKLLEEFGKTNELDKAIELCTSALQADLPEVFATMASTVREMALREPDFLAMCRGAIALIQLRRYGSIYQTEPPMDWLPVIEELLQRLFLRLPAALMGLNDDEAELHTIALSDLHQAMPLIESVELKQQWLACLHTPAYDPKSHPMTAGMATRIRLDGGAEPEVNVQILMSRHLTLRNEPIKAAAWLRGFLQQAGWVLMYHPRIRQLINDWLDTLDEDLLSRLLPTLRSATADYSIEERQQILQTIIVGDEAILATIEPETEPMQNPVYQSVRVLFG
jgi:Family of unknown function (DUF5682)